MRLLVTTQLALSSRKRSHEMAKAFSSFGCTQTVWRATAVLTRYSNDLVLGYRVDREFISGSPKGQSVVSLTARNSDAVGVVGSSVLALVAPMPVPLR